MANIGIIGECMIEINGKPFSSQLSQSYGGDTLNTAVYLARLAPEHNIYYITAIGEDAISNEICAKWQAENIKTDHILRFKNKHLGLYWILLDDKGERSFMYWRGQAAAKDWLQHDETSNVLASLMDYEWIYLSGISLAILNQEDRNKLINWLKEYRIQGGKIAFDSNFRPVLWASKTEITQTYSQILEITDLALLTSDDETKIWEISEAQVQKNLNRFNIPTIILKQGELGALLIKNHQATLIEGFKVEKVIDTTAAGDSFNAGVLAGLLKNYSIEQACKAGHLLASTVIQYQGAIIPKSNMPHDI